MNLKKSILMTLVLFLVAGTSQAEKVVLKVDTEKSKVSWVGTKVAGAHNGVLQLSGGEIVMDGEKVSGGSFKIAMSTIENKDLTDPKYKAKLENHLKSDDFFNVSKFPLAEFAIKEVTYLEGKAVIKGTLTVKGISKELSFPANIEKKGEEFVGSANLKIDRTKWDIRYNSSKFFDPGNLGDKLIYDDIEISLLVVAAPEA